MSDRAYSLCEALLIEMGRELQQEGALVPVEELRLLDLINVERLPTDDGNRLWSVFRAAREHVPEYYRRTVSAWHCRDATRLALFRRWLREQHGGTGPENMKAALDWLVTSYGHAGLSYDQAEQLTLMEALHLACPEQQAGEGLSPPAEQSPAAILEDDNEGLLREAADGKAKHEEPRKLLIGWHDIVDALDMNYCERDKVKRANKLFDGPIRNHGKGTRPMVYRDDLIDWWNKLAVKQQELANQREGGRLSAEAQHNYGREGTAAPEIGGGVKKRRRDRRT